MSNSKRSNSSKPGCTIISILNQKGGVGKTTTAVNLGAALAEAEQRTLLIDLDAQHNASTLCGVKNATLSIFDVLLDGDANPLECAITRTTILGLDLVPGARALAGLESALMSVVGREQLLDEAIAGVRDRYDYILIDNGPTLGIAPAMSLCAADLALVPLQCERLALEGLAQVHNTITLAKRRTNPNLELRILLTMLDSRTTDGKQIATSVRKRFGPEVCHTVIKRSSKLALGSAQAGSILQYAPTNDGAVAYRELAQEILKS